MGQDADDKKENKPQTESRGPTVRRSEVGWLSRSDQQILLRLWNHPNEELVLSPAPLSDNVAYSHSSVRQRLSHLLDKGMVQYHDEDRGVYKLTDKARAWLRGEADQDDLEEWDD